MANRIVKIEDICHVVKGETGIMKAIPGEYPMVVLSEERKTHNEYQFDCKAVIIPLVSSTGHGHASMKRIHYQEGKFALGSILCALVPKKEGEYDPEYLYHILDMGKERIFVPLMKGMANVSLPMNRIKSVEINLPPYNEQVRLSKIYSEVTTNLDLLKNQTDKQHKYLKQLRQSILQLAVQGKLTVKWREANPNVEPASVLLEKIKAEKEELIREGKIRREKPLPKISENEIQSELPKNWAWCRFIQLTDYRKGKKPVILVGAKSNEYSIPYIDIEAFEKGVIKQYTNDPKSVFCNNSNILIVWDGARMGLVGKNASGAVGSTIAKIDIFLVILDYLYMLLKSKYEYFNKNPKQAGLPHLNGYLLDSLVIGLPPLEEQNEIVNEVNKLLSLCDELEKKIEKRDSYQERIMQAIVKQAFTTNLETVETE